MSHGSRGMVRMVDWIFRGAAAGAALGLWEGVATALSGRGIPWGYPVAAAGFDVALGALLGLGIGLGWRFATGRRAQSEAPPGFAAAFTLPMAALTLVYLADKVDVAAAYRGIGPALPVLVALAGGSVAAALALVLLRRWARTGRPELSAALGFLLVGLWLAGGRWLTRSGPGSYTTLAGIVLNLVLLALLAGALLLQDRLLARPPGHARLSPRRLAATLAGLALGASLLAGVAAPGIERAPDRPGPRATEAAAPNRPNVLLITLDTLRADHVSAYGYRRETTPHLDALAAEGILYRHALSPSSWTLPGHASLFTGLLPTEHGAHHHPADGPVTGVRPAPPLAGAHQTLAEVLHAAGYRTGAVVANIGYLNRSFAIDQGFEHYDNRPRREIGYVPLAGEALRRCLPVAHDRLIMPYRQAGAVVDSAESWLDRGLDQGPDRGLDRKRHDRPGEPFFLFLNFMDAHDPYAPPAPFGDRFPGASPFLSEPTDAVLSGERDPTPAERRHFAALYDGEIAYADQEIGRLFEHLRSLGVYDRTLIVVTADHGEFFGEHRLWHHNVGPYEPVHRIPLIVKPARAPDAPAAPGGRTEERWTELTGVFRLILGDVGLPLPPEAAASVTAGPDAPLVAEQYRNEYFVLRYGARFDRDYHALYEPPWKLVLDSRGDVTLFDLDRDPGEEHDLAAREPERVAAMKARLEDALERARELAARTGNGTGEEKDLDPEVVRRLRALGYVN